jgi:hypothetical protein
MSELKITGKVTAILPLEKGVSKAGKDYQKQSFVIDTGAKFNPLVAFGVFGEEKCKDLITPLSVGQDVEVGFNLSSREFKDKYYTQADAWRITAVEDDTQQSQPEEVSDGLPF